MARYVILLPGDENQWAAASADERAAMYAVHERFGTALADRGHVVTGGAELTHSREATTLRGDGDGGVTVTDGPFAELAEQVTGFYLVETEDRADLVDCCRILAAAGDGVEIRPAVGSEAS